MKIEKKETTYTVQFTEHEMVLLWEAVDADWECLNGRYEMGTYEDDEQKEAWEQTLADEEQLLDFFRQTVFKR